MERRERGEKGGTSEGIGKRGDHVMREGESYEEKGGNLRRKMREGRNFQEERKGRNLRTRGEKDSARRGTCDGRGGKGKPDRGFVHLLKPSEKPKSTSKRSIKFAHVVDPFTIK